MRMFSIFLLLVYSTTSDSYGYDSGTDQGACGRPYRSSRMHRPPCDLARQNYCTTAGTTYPWHAVRRFVRENQGLMKRMYGDERHISILRAELTVHDRKKPHLDEGDDIGMVRSSKYSRFQHDLDNELFDERNGARYYEERKDDVILNTKFVYGQEPSMQIKLKDLHAPKFRPMTQKPTTTTAKPTTANSTMPTSTAKTQENTTSSEALYDDDETVTTTDEEDSSSTTTVTEEYEEPSTVTEEEILETTTQFLKKETTGELLFQDTENTKPHATHHNYKLRGVNACPVKEEVVAPFWANNTRGEVLALLNMYPFEQYVHWEKCTHEHRQMYCREGCRCEQQYRLHRLLAYDPNNECRGIFSDWFRFPSCCVCKCYDMPAEFRVTSRSPRAEQQKPPWVKKRKSKVYNKEKKGH